MGEHRPPDGSGLAGDGLRTGAAGRARRLFRAVLAATLWLLFCAAAVVVLDLVAIARAEDASLRQAQSDLKDSLGLAQRGLGSEGGGLVEAEIMAAHARSEATAAQQRMTHDPLLAVVGRLPAANRQLVAARELNSVVIEATDISVRAETLAADFQAARHATGKPSTLDVAGRFYVDHRGEIESVAARALALPDKVATVDRRDLVTPLRKAYDRLDRPMQLIIQQREPVRTALGLAPVILGADRPANYLLLFADNTELRPGGGFIGTFGVLGFDHGSYNKPVVTRVGIVEDPEVKLRSYLAGGPHYVPEPAWLMRAFPEFARQTLTLGNSAITPSWPDNARLAQTLYTSETGKQADGVVQLDLTAISYVVAVTGPIELPRENQAPVVITAESAPDILVAETRTKDKSLLSVLQEKLIARLETMSPEQLGRVLKALQRASEERHLLVTMNDPALQALVDRNGLARPIPAPVADAILPVFANGGANKTDLHLARSLRVSVQANGHHHVELTVANNSSGPELISRSLEFVRLFTPPDARLVTIRGFILPGNLRIPSLPYGDLGIENGWKTSGGWLQVRAGHQFTVSWDYTTAPIGPDYRLTLVKQPGVGTYPVEVTLTAPGYTSADGINDPGSVTWHVDLSRDVTLSASHP